MKTEYLSRLVSFKLKNYKLIQKNSFDILLVAFIGAKMLKFRLECIGNCYIFAPVKVTELVVVIKVKLLLKMIR